MRKKSLLIVFLLYTTFIHAEHSKSANKTIRFLFQKTLFSTNIEKNNTQNDPRIKVFPNPTNENFKIEIELEKNVEVEINIYNAIGKSILSTREFGTSGTYIKTIFFEDQPSGIYFINIKAGEIKTVERLVKIK